MQRKENGERSAAPDLTEMTTFDEELQMMKAGIDLCINVTLCFQTTQRSQRLTTMQAETLKRTSYCIFNICYK